MRGCTKNQQEQIVCATVAYTHFIDAAYSKKKQSSPYTDKPPGLFIKVYNSVK